MDPQTQRAGRNPFGPLASFLSMLKSIEFVMMAASAAYGAWLVGHVRFLLGVRSGTYAMFPLESADESGGPTFLPATTGEIVKGAVLALGCFAVAGGLGVRLLGS